MRRGASGRRAAIAAVSAIVFAAACGSDGGSELSGIAQSDVDTTASTAAPPASASESASESEPTDSGDGAGSAADTATEASGRLASSYIGGLDLTAVAIARQDDTLRVDFSITNRSDSSHTWTGQMKARSSPVSQLGAPTGVQIIDPAAQAVFDPIIGEDGSCVCSPLGSLRGGETGQYHITFAGVAPTDFELYLPTFPLLSVRADVVQPADDLAADGLSPASESSVSLILDAAAAYRRSGLVVVQFAITNPTDSSHTFTGELSSGGVSHLQLPSGVSIFDTATQQQLTPLELGERPCVCSGLGSLSGGASGTYFVFFGAVDAEKVNVTIPTFALISDLPIR